MQASGTLWLDTSRPGGRQCGTARRRRADALDEVTNRRLTIMSAESWSALRPVMFVAALLLLAVAFRLMWDRFLDPFEDGYQNWWIASSFVETGTYTDRFSQMTRGNWLPGYEFFAAGLVALLGSHIMPLLKASNIFFSLGTTAIVYLLARPRGQLTASLAAATLRYEVWGFVGLYMLWSCRSRSITRRELAILAFPAAAFALAWFVWTSQYGFLPSMIIAQTSTDVQYKESVGTLAPVSDRLTSFFTWYLSWTPLALVAIAWLVMRERKSVCTGIISLFYGAEILYTAAGFGNPSPRYIHLTVPIICICSANGIKGIG